MNYRSNFGFTLVELIVALAISTMVLAAVYHVFISNNRIYLKQNEMVKMEQNLRSGLNLLERNIRMAGYDPTENYTLGVNKTASTENLIVISYYDDTAENEEEHTPVKLMYDIYNSDTYGAYTLAKRKVALSKDFDSTTRQPLMTNVESLEFSYCDKNHMCSNTASAIADICYIKVFLQTFSSKDHFQTPDLNMTKTVYIRNACL